MKRNLQSSKGLLLVFCLSLLFLSCDKDKTASGDLTVSGNLINASGPVANATVNIDDLIQYETTTDAQGHFEINKVSAGEHKLNYSIGSNAGSYSKVSERIQVNSNLVLENLLLPEPVVLNEPIAVRRLEDNEVLLSWSSYSGADFREYKLYKHSSSGLDETTGELLHVATIPQDTTFTLNLDHNSNTFFRVFVTDEVGALSGSNIENLEIGSFETDPEIFVGTQGDFYLNAGTEMELYFDVPSAGLYQVAWFDGFFNPYTSGSIVVAAQNADKTDYYFRNERLIPETGSPLPIFVPANERVYLTVKGFNPDTSGSFGVKITPLEPLPSAELVIGEPLNVRFEKGEMKMYFFEATAGQDYQLTIGNTDDTGAYGDGSITHLTIMKESASTFEYYKEFIPLPCCGGEDNYSLSVTTDQKVFIIIDCAYYGETNAVNMVVTAL